MEGFTKCVLSKELPTKRRWRVKNKTQRYAHAMDIKSALVENTCSLLSCIPVETLGAILSILRCFDPIIIADEITSYSPFEQDLHRDKFGEREALCVTFTSTGTATNTIVIKGSHNRVFSTEYTTALDPSRGSQVTDSRTYLEYATEMLEEAKDDVNSSAVTRESDKDLINLTIFDTAAYHGGPACPPADIKKRGRFFITFIRSTHASDPFPKTLLRDWGRESFPTCYLRDLLTLQERANVFKVAAYITPQS